MIQYPAGLPYPLRQGYGLTPVSPLRRSELQTGRARQRRSYTSVPTMADVSWLMNDRQAMIFEGWFRDGLLDGAQWFDCPLKLPTGTRTYVARFVDIYHGPVLVGRSHWQYSARLELRERPILDNGWSVVAPEYIYGMDIFDIAMNREWPDA